MPDAKSHSEPSMEEIIASISRVIAEDIHPGRRRVGEVQLGGKVPPVPREGGDVLELTQVVNEDGSVRRITPRVAAKAAPLADPVMASGSPAVNVTGRIEPQVHVASESTLDPVRERLLSTATAGAAAAAFAQLGALPRDRHRERELPPDGAERTLGDVVREMLRPMLQSWLDEHLPGIVERLVREEIARVIGEAGLR
jgi:cell pole-organizing protein PopZ